MNNCDHICSEQCRRTGCNCACGEYHLPKSMTLYTITPSTMSPEATLADEAGVRKFFAALALPWVDDLGETHLPIGWRQYARMAPIDNIVKSLRVFEYIVDVNYQI